MQGQRVHVVGVEEGWGRELPGLVDLGVGRGEERGWEGRGEKMKIAWRYEGLGEFGEGRPRGGFEAFVCTYYEPICFRPPCSVNTASGLT